MGKLSGNEMLRFPGTAEKLNSNRKRSSNRKRLRKEIHHGSKEKEVGERGSRDRGGNFSFRRL